MIRKKQFDGIFTDYLGFLYDELIEVFSRFLGSEYLNSIEYVETARSPPEFRKQSSQFISEPDKYLDEFDKTVHKLGRPRAICLTETTGKQDVNRVMGRFAKKRGIELYLIPRDLINLGEIRKSAITERV